MSTNTNSRISDTDQLYELFKTCSFKELQLKIMKTEDREEKIFYRTIYNLKLQIGQEKVVGEKLV